MLRETSIGPDETPFLSDEARAGFFLISAETRLAKQRCLEGEKESV
jgi:hypothetical protein